MDFDFSTDQYAMRDEARRFLEAQCPTSHVREFLDEDAAFSRDLWKQMASLGWCGLAFEERYGGLGQSFLDLVLLLGELGRVLAPVPFLSSVCFAGQAIERHGSASQKERWLPAIASGERIAAYAEGGLVLDGPAADLFVVSDGKQLWVHEDGFTVTPRRGFDRTRTIGTVRFEGSGIPLEKPGTSRALLVSAVCAEMVGVAERVLEMTVAYSKDREQFGRPIGSFQAIKHRCAEMAVDLESSRAAAYYACWAAATDAEDAEDAELAASVAKSYCGEALARLGGEGVQVHGGIAFTWEHDMHLYLRRIKSDEALLGDVAFHRDRIASLSGL